MSDFWIDRREHEWEISDWTEIVNMWMKNVCITVAWQDVWTRSKDWWYEKNIHKDQSLWLWTTKVSFASIQINLPLFHVNWRLKHMQLLSGTPSEAEQRNVSVRYVCRYYRLVILTVYTFYRIACSCSAVISKLGVNAIINKIKYDIPMKHNIWCEFYAKI